MVVEGHLSHRLDEIDKEEMDCQRANLDDDRFSFEDAEDDDFDDDFDEDFEDEDEDDENFDEKFEDYDYGEDVSGL